MLTGIQPYGGGDLAHPVHSLVVDDLHLVEPQFRSVVAVEIEGPVARIRNGDGAGVPSRPVVVEAIVEPGPCAGGRSMVDVRLGAPVVGSPSSQVGHLTGVVRESGVVEVLCEQAAGGTRNAGRAGSRFQHPFQRGVATLFHRSLTTPGECLTTCQRRVLRIPVLRT